MKRLVIYATYNKSGIVDDYIVYMLDQLNNFSDAVIVVSNNFYLPEEKAKLKYASRIYERDDVGYDVGGFSYVINKLWENGEINNYDELILLNDSIFGPFYSLQELFDEMERRDPELDFWGITKRGKSDFDGGDSIFPEHLQIYFYVFRKRLLHSSDFREYWSGIINKVTDFRSAIVNYEFEFTKYFQIRGYKWESYCGCNEFITQNPRYNLSPYHYGMYDLIKNERCPFLKRKLFTGDFVNKKFTDTLDLKRAVEYIEKHTDYNVDLIWKHVLQSYQMADILQAMHMSEIVDQCSISEYDRISKVEIIDIYRNVLKEDEKECSSTTEYLLYVAVEEEIEPAPLRNAYINNVKENLCENQSYVKTLVDMFCKEKRLGVLVPPFCTFGEISKSLERKWRDEDVFRYIKDKYHLSIPISEEHAPIHVIKGFICRKEIISSDLLSDIKNDKTGTVMQMLPLLAQQYGYYTKTVINKKYAPALLDNVFSIVNTVLESKNCKFNMDFDIEGIEDTFFEEQIRNFVQGQKKVYIYGAGQLAYRIINIIKSIVSISGIIVSDKNGNSEYVAGYRVQSIDDISEIDPCILVAVGRKNNSVIAKKLQEKQFYNYILLG